MKIINVYSDYKKDLEDKNPKYKKIACINYFIFAIFLIINILFYLLILINNPILSSICVIIYAINKYGFNFALCFISLINSFLQGKVNLSVYTIISYLSSLIMIISSILIFILL